MTRIAKARKSRSPTLALLAAMGGIALCFSLLVWGLRARDLSTAANLAQLVSIPLTLLPLVIPLLRWWHQARRPTRVTAADIAQLRGELAPLVYERWRTESRIRALDDPDPIPVQWHRTGDQRLIDAPGNLTNNVLTVASSADVATLIADFRQLRRGRLVILGGAGAGKTTLAVQILLELLRERVDDSAAPVPVLLSGASWDPERYRTLWDWVAYAIEQDYPELLVAGHQAQVVRDLAVQGHVMPVIDGFDEATAEVRPQLLEAMHTAMDGSTQLIVTSRADEYLAAVEAYGRVLPSAVVIEPQPLSADAAADYIERCLPADPGPSWRALLTRLRTADEQDKPARAIAEVASAPLGLWLLRVAYLTPRTDPAPLLDDVRFVEANALRTHLFDRLVAATVMTRPPSNDPADFFRPRRQYDPTDVERWLRFLAGNLDRWGSKDFDWARDVPALTAPAHPERIADRLTLIVTAVRAYVDVVSAQRPRLGIPLALFPLVPAGLVCYIIGRLTAAVLGLFIGEGASSLLGVVVGVGVGLGLIVAAVRVLLMAADYRDGAGMDWAESLLADWANIRDFVGRVVPALTFALAYALLVGASVDVAISVIAPDASVGWLVGAAAGSVGLLAMSGYQIDPDMPPGPGTTAPWYGIRPYSALRGSLLGGLLFGLLGGVLLVAVGGQQQAFLAMTVLATTVACGFLIPLLMIVIPVLYGLTSLCVGAVRRLRGRLRTI
ncbi:NACHT domain-containing protein [Actinoplanes sp. NPDC051851]|uniref:NACHT domain-containing protein n=1 Tax=Actinoplanes sp. NPDC051851 TaxID=3154753 RepID=UPI00341C4641